MGGSDRFCYRISLWIFVATRYSAYKPDAGVQMNEVQSNRVFEIERAIKPRALQADH